MARAEATKRGSNRGAQLLRDYMDEHELSCVALAARLGCSKQYVSFLKNGDKTPGLELAVKISDLTGVPASSWTKSAQKSAR